MCVAFPELKSTCHWVVFFFLARGSAPIPLPQSIEEKPIVPFTLLQAFQNVRNGLNWFHHHTKRGIIQPWKTILSSSPDCKKVSYIWKSILFWAASPTPPRSGPQFYHGAFTLFFKLPFKFCHLINVPSSKKKESSHQGKFLSSRQKTQILDHTQTVSSSSPFTSHPSTLNDRLTPTLLLQ